MDRHEEIKELRLALQASPGNSYLRKLLIRKIEFLPEYQAELEELLQAELKADPANLEWKKKLIHLFYRQQKFSTCIVISEDLGDIRELDLQTQAVIAKCYLETGEMGIAQSIYRGILAVEPDFEDEQLDRSFRLKGQAQESETDLEDRALFSKPDITFEHVGGMEVVKREIDLKIIKPLENAELYAAYGKKVGGGILLYGPPGCGKTYIARATAGQINANFINITLNDILDMWVGQSEKNLNKYFELARQKKPCVIFFDEVDALGAKRSDMRQSAGKNVINQFLAELDGIQSNNEGVLIIGATNTPWHLDPAFLRPGRFDRIIFVPPPDEKTKMAILQLKLKDKPQKNIDYAKVAKKTKNYSGADLNAVIDIAIEKIIEEALQSGHPRPIETKDLLEAVDRHKASTTEWFSVARNYAVFANKSGLYDDILKYLK